MYREALPSSLLRSIVDRVAHSVTASQAAEPLSELKAQIKDLPGTRDFNSSLGKGFGLIAEIKRKSPSLGEMWSNDVESIARVYAESEAVRAVSVLTNFDDFGMGIEELRRVRAIVPQPILRKDFIFDPYQVYQARAYGADAILLMANVVTKEGLQKLFELAQELNLGVLFESHTEEDIRKIPGQAMVYGINSRRFMAGKGKSTRFFYAASRVLRWLGKQQDLSIDLTHFELARKLPATAIKVAESGVKPSMVSRLRDELHFDSMLVGTSILMAKGGVKKAIREFEDAMSVGASAPASLGPRLHHAAA